MRHAGENDPSRAIQRILLRPVERIPVLRVVIEAKIHRDRLRLDSVLNLVLDRLALQLAGDACGGADEALQDGYRARQDDEKGDPREMFGGHGTGRGRGHGVEDQLDRVQQHERNGGLDQQQGEAGQRQARTAFPDQPERSQQARRALMQ